SNQGWLCIPKRSTQPLVNARTIFTDAGKRSRKAAVTWKEEGEWSHKILDACPEDSLQTLELLAVVWAMTTWLHEPVNVITDSLYVANVTSRIEDAEIKE
ncbi:POK6 protein, partial [Alopecoenas beccarii]|nr:POK6 protein [Alopecoenas beccarii]